jgi:hypothetical protein
MSFRSFLRRGVGVYVFALLVALLCVSGIRSSDAAGSRASVASPLKSVQHHFQTLTQSPCYLQLSSLNLFLIPWLTSGGATLPITLSPGVYSYTLTRSASHAILQLSASAPAGVAVHVYLNNAIQSPDPLGGAILDLVLKAGPNVLKIVLTKGDCTNTYYITINDTGNDNLPCTAPNVQVQIGGVNLWVTDAWNNVFPLVITPTWDGLNSWFYVAYIPGNINLNGATFSFQITGLTPTAWFRYAINHGPFLYGNPLTPISATLVAGTNLIQLDALQLYSCGDYIAEYSITLYPCAQLLPTEATGFTLGLSHAGTPNVVIPLTVTPPYSPSTLPFYVAYEGPSDFTGGLIHFTPFYQSGTFRYSINFGPYIYGTPSGSEIVGALKEGTNLIQFDVIQPSACGDYIAEYSITIYAGSPPTPAQP